MQLRKESLEEGITSAKGEHIACVIEALTDKFTMRSKAHKRLTKYFLQKVIIEQSIE